MEASLLLVESLRWVSIPCAARTPPVPHPPTARLSASGHRPPLACGSPKSRPLNTRMPLKNYQGWVRAKKILRLQRARLRAYGRGGTSTNG